LLPPVIKKASPEAGLLSCLQGLDLALYSEKSEQVAGRSMSQFSPATLDKQS